MNYLVTDGSSYNTLNNNEGSTGDFIGLMAADPLPGTSTLSTFGPSHDNLIENNTIHTDRPTGNEIKAGVAPAFLGGIVVLNGTYNNTIQNNQTFASFGSDLAWAQAVPNNNSPIGVDNYPPTLHCNVTASGERWHLEPEWQCLEEQHLPDHRSLFAGAVRASS